MRKAAALLVLAVVAVPAGPARAASGPPLGRGCFGAGVTVAGTWHAAFAGGPVAAPGSVVEISCEVVDAVSGEVVAAVSSGPRPDVAHVADRLSYPDDGGEYDYCTSVTVDGVSWRQAGTGTWAPGGRDCPGPTQVPPECLPLAPARRSCDYLGSLFRTLDSTLCPVTGDVDVAGQRVWDCPPYQ